jgi:hypothetical protein
MGRTNVSEGEVPLCDFSLGMWGWQQAYEAAVERIAFETAAKCTNSYDPTVYYDAVAASVFHPRAKSEIVRRFLTSVRDLTNSELGLWLDFEMTRYEGEYSRGGTAYGRIEPHMTTAEIVDKVSAILSAKCETAVEFEGEVEQGYFFDWCLECIEIGDARDIYHVPEGTLARAIAERLQEAGVVLDCLRMALNPEELTRRLADPARIAADLKYRARAAYF